MPPSLNIFISGSSASIDSDALSSRPPTYSSSLTDSPTYQLPYGNTFDHDSESMTTWNRTPSTASSRASRDLDTRHTFAHRPRSSRPSLPNRYLYYRIYAEDGAIPLEKPLYASDPYLGCILASSVSPPHDAASIKQYICKIEKIITTAASCLYMTPSDHMPIDDEAHVAIVACAGPGSVPDTPLALVFKLTTTDIVSRKMPIIRKLGALTKPSPPMDPQYLYYRLYVDKKNVRCKSARRKDPYLGRINANLIVPPHTVTSLRQCIIETEGIDSVMEPRLYAELNSTSPVDEGHISIFTGDCPGSTPEKPMGLVCTTPINSPGRNPEFPTRIKAKQNRVHSSANPTFLNFKKNDILHTDYCSRLETYHGNGLNGESDSARTVKVFQATNSAGVKGFVMEGDVTVAPTLTSATGFPVGRFPAA